MSVLAELAGLACLIHWLRPKTVQPCTVLTAVLWLTHDRDSPDLHSL
ncbi:hypothetical protein SCH4B_4482 [Ruegeria sp. TrichCH4B]|nr:hypothetical protein SCH4B_4482 [Ruegeria sp. TrichCH4B]